MSEYNRTVYFIQFIIEFYKKYKIKKIDEKYNEYFLKINNFSKKYDEINKINKEKLDIDREELDLDDCKIIMKYPLKICKYKNIDVSINIGPYGYYMRYKNKNYRIDQNPDKWTKEYILEKL